MAHLWFRNADDLWSVAPLSGEAVDISVSPPRPVQKGFCLGEHADAAVVHARGGDAAVWVLLEGVEGDVRLNGFAPVAGMRVLQDRDEIRVHGCDTLFFSAETLAHAETFPGAENIIYCGRCRLPIQNAQTAVRCPRCGIWHHEIAERKCWTYGPACAFCPQPTALDAGYSWVPEA